MGRPIPSVSTDREDAEAVLDSGLRALDYIMARTDEGNPNEPRRPP